MCVTEDVMYTYILSHCKILSGKFVCMCVCLSVPQPMKNYSCEVKPE